MFDGLLQKLFEKIAEAIGGKAAALVLDDTTRNKNASFELYRALRALEEALERLAKDLDGASDAEIEHASPRWSLIDILTLDDLASSLKSAQDAFDQINAQIEIYGSRHDMERLRLLLIADHVSKDALFANDLDRYTVDQWKELVRETSKAARMARGIVAAFIGAKFPI
jgi:hypothetical protein